MRVLIFLAVVAVLAVEGYEWADCDPKTDGHAPYPNTGGPFKQTTFLNTTYNSHMLYGLYPTRPNATEKNGSTDGPDKFPDKFPVILFMHGSTGQWEMYSPNIQIYASHGFIVLFPFVKTPEKDKNPLTTNTNGKFLINALDYVNFATTDPSSPLYRLADTDNIVISGHSMGATCAIEAGKNVTSRPNNGGVKLIITQHPGICGPFGPPPLPATWMPEDLATINQHLPFIHTTATNDGAFWPAPATAKHEYGCFNKTMAKLPSPPPNANLFVQFSTAACTDDGKRKPFKDNGHDCPFKDNVETPWFTTAVKLYAHHNGSSHTVCSNMLFGAAAPGTLQGDKNVEIVVVNAK